LPKNSTVDINPLNFPRHFNPLEPLNLAYHLLNKDVEILKMRGEFMKFWGFIALAFALILSSSHTKKFEKGRGLANTKDAKKNSLKDLRNRISLEQAFTLKVGDLKRYRVVEKPELIITFKNLGGDLYTKLSWQADYGFQRVKTNSIKANRVKKEYKDIQVNLRGKYNAQVKQVEGVLFFQRGADRELELEEII
jgi:hypothetical protein